MAFRVENRGKGPAEIYIMEEIGVFGVSAKDVGAAMPALKQEKEIILHLNSVGGSFFDGIAIYNLLLGVRDRLTVNIEGIAASAASTIALAGKTVNMAAGSWFMMHEAQGHAAGNANGLRTLAEQLDGFTNTIAGIYASKTGRPQADHLAELTDNEIWLDATQAKAGGYIDKITNEGQKIAASLDPKTAARFIKPPAALIMTDPAQIRATDIHRARAISQRAKLLD